MSTRALILGFDGGDPFWNSVQALWFNDNAASGSTTFTDQSQNNFSLTQVYGNNASYTNATAPTGMTTSVLFTTTNAKALQHTTKQSAWAFPGDFTFEYFLRRNGAQTSIPIDFRDATVTNNMVTVINASNHKLVYSAADKILGALLSDLTWTHYAITRSGSSVQMWKDGTQTGSTATDSTSWPNSPLTIGDEYLHDAPLNGWICSLRITKGVARYTAAFQVPTLPLPKRL